MIRFSLHQQKHNNSSRRLPVKKLVIITFCLILLMAVFACSDSEINDERAAENENAGIIEQNSEENDAVTTNEPVQEIPDVEEQGEQNTDDESEENVNSDTDTWERGYFPFSFTAEDLYGSTVTEESMGERQLFFLHLWATWCPPCIVEMQDIAEIAKEYGDRVGFLGLLDDFSSNPDGAKNILESAGMPEFFINIDARLPELRELVELVNTGSVPTTIIITAEGNMTEPLVGAYGSAYSIILDYLLELQL